MRMCVGTARVHRYCQHTHAQSKEFRERHVRRCTHTHKHTRIETMWSDVFFMDRFCVVVLKFCRFRCTISQSVSWRLYKQSTRVYVSSGVFFFCFFFYMPTYAMYKSEYTKHKQRENIYISFNVFVLIHFFLCVMCQMRMNVIYVRTHFEESKK